MIKNRDCLFYFQHPAQNDLLHPKTQIIIINTKYIFARSCHLRLADTEICLKVHTHYKSYKCFVNDNVLFGAVYKNKGVHTFLGINCTSMKTQSTLKHEHAHTQWRKPRKVNPVNTHYISQRDICRSQDTNPRDLILSWSHTL